jgi:serine/threonine-protein kinase
VVHDHVLKVLDVGLRDDGAPYLVMEYLFGESLGDWLARERVMPPAQGLPLVRQVASGLSAAHREGVIHRDIKPGNIYLVGEKGVAYCAKVVDFGFARLTEMKGLTQAGMAVGTIEYMAPEQAVGDAPEPRTDMYGLGVLMYRMFTGRIPFSMRDDAELLAHHLIEPPPRPALPADGISPRLEAVILKAMRKRPENRYASMDELIADIDRIAQPASPLLATKDLPAPDVYVPKSTFAINTARYFYKLLGKQGPPTA